MEVEDNDDGPIWPVASRRVHATSHQAQNPDVVGEDQEEEQEEEQPWPGQQAAANQWDDRELVALCHFMVEKRMLTPNGTQCWGTQAIRRRLTTSYPIIRLRGANAIVTKLKNSWRSHKRNVWHDLRPLLMSSGLSRRENLHEARAVVQQWMEVCDVTEDDFTRPLDLDRPRTTGNQEYE